MRFVENYDQSVRDYMTAGERLVTASVGTTLAEAQKLLQKHRIEKLPLVDEDGILKGLITVKDIMKKRDFPLSATDSRGRLLAAAAVGVTGDWEERLAALVEKGLDAVVIDTAHGHSKAVLRATSRAKTRFPDLTIIGGNVAHRRGNGRFDRRRGRRHQGSVSGPVRSAPRASLPVRECPN